MSAQIQDRKSSGMRARISVLNLSAIFPRECANKYMGFLVSAIDESSDRKQLYAFITAGWVSQQSFWHDCERAWESKLDKEDLKYFKYSECLTLSGQFRKFRALPKPEGRVKANEILADFSLIARSSRLAGVVLALKMEDYKRIRKSSRSRQMLPPNPYRFAYQHMLIRIADKVAHLPRPDTVAFLCDDHCKFKEVKESYDALKDQNPSCAPWMGSLTSMSDKDSSALQAADLLAGICRSYCTKYFRGTITKEALTQAVKAEAGKAVEVGIVNEHFLKLFTEANLLKDGKPALRSTKQLALFNELWS